MATNTGAGTSPFLLSFRAGISELVSVLHDRGVVVYLVSGGFRQARYDMRRHKRQKRICGFCAMIAQAGGEVKLVFYNRALENEFFLTEVPKYL